MKLKKAISLILAISCLMSMTVFSAHATDEYSQTGIDKTLYNQFTVDFSTTTYNSKNPDDTAQHKANVNSAIAFVKSLGLAEQGYKYIEDSCLDQLQDFLDEDNFVLESYTVLTPKVAAVAPTYYGTYNGFTFYSAYYSTYKSQVIEDTSKIGKNNVSGFLTGVFKFFVDFAGSTLLSISYDNVRQENGGNFTVSENDEVMHRYSLNCNCRGIYLQSGSNGYTRYYSSDDGTVKSEIFYMRPGEDTIVFRSREYYVVSPNFNDKTYQMQQAYNWIMSSGTEYPERHNLPSYVGKIYLGQFVDCF